MQAQAQRPDTQTEFQTLDAAVCPIIQRLAKKFSPEVVRSAYAAAGIKVETVTPPATEGKRGAHPVGGMECASNGGAVA